ncbi:MAG: hypothetical protein ABR981_03080 [Candidatus Micrarchaeaceae archaeon]|jgi:hypothetical protein
MQSKTKSIILLIGAILIAVIFISAYASFNNNNVAGSTSTSTVASQQTFYSTGSVNAIIENYSYITYVTFSNSTNSSKNNVTNLLSSLEANGIVDNYIYTNNSFEVVLNNITAYQLQQEIYNTSKDSNSINVGSTAQITLPASATLYYTNTPISIHLTSRNYSVYLNNVKSVGSTINVGISALLTRNGSVYNNQIKISYNP